MSFIYDMTDTWTVGATTYTAIKMNVTDTASAAASLLMDLQLGSASKFNVSKLGTTKIVNNNAGIALQLWGDAADGVNDATSGVQISIIHNSIDNRQFWIGGSDSGYGGLRYVSYTGAVEIDTTTSSGGASTATIAGFASYTAIAGGSFKWSGRARLTSPGDGQLQLSNDAVSSYAMLAADAANTLALRNSTNAQVFRVYNTYTDASNYERGVLSWESNVFVVGSQKLGTGASRDVRLRSDGNLIFTGGGSDRAYFNTSGNFLFITDNTYDIGAAGATRPRTGYFGTSIVTPIATITQGTITANAPQIDGSVTWNNAGVTFTGWKLNVTNTASGIGSLLFDFQLGGASLCTLSRLGTMAITGGISIYNAAGLSIVSDSGKLVIGASLDAILTRDAADTLAQRNGTNTQRFNIYNTYTDASNYERALFDWKAVGNTFSIYTNAAGSGTARGIQLFGGSGATLEIGANAGVQWRITTSGHLIAITDNTYDIGASGATRPRIIYPGMVVKYASITLTSLSASVIGAASAGAGAMAYISDASVPVAFTTVAGGGTTPCPVYSDGTQWRAG